MDIEQRLQFATMARSAQSDLTSVDAIFRASPEIENWLVAFKLATVALGNLVDLEPQLRLLYREASELSISFKAFEQGANFCRYLRNTSVAHRNPSLMAQAIAWKPEIRSMILNNDSKVSNLIDLFVLETAINTYIQEGGSHRILDSETDLIYPPDFKRFNGFLEATITAAIFYLEILVAKLLEGHVAPTPTEIFTLAGEAGLVDFGFVTKGKR